MEIQNDTSGITSLAGFAFQIKVFCSYASKLRDSQQIEFESIDDIATNKKVKANNLDTVNGKIQFSDYRSIQVKHTTLSDDLAKRVLMNWILLESSSLCIEKYILVTDVNYDNIDLLQTINIDSFIQEVLNSDKKRNATISKVKEIFQRQNKSENKKNIENVIKKHKFCPIDVDEELDKNFMTLFFKAANSVVYYQRLEEFVSRITNKIFKSVLLSQPYVLTYDNFIKIINDINQNFTVNVSLPSYIDFRNINPIDLSKIEIANSREYKQLLHCNVSENTIRRHLLHEQYYRKIRNNYIDACLNSKCENIEVTAYENFEEVKEDLQDRNEDNPKNRLKETTKASNSYAESNQIREGVCIYLTSKNIDKNIQISWKDE